MGTTNTTTTTIYFYYFMSTVFVVRTNITYTTTTTNFTMATGNSKIGIATLITTTFTLLLHQSQVK